METFEFINICQIHSMSKIMGVLTHIDLIDKSSRLKSIKKILKHRFWTEVYQVYLYFQFLVCETLELAVLMRYVYSV